MSHEDDGVEREKVDEEVSIRRKGDYKVSWVGSLDFSPVRYSTDNCSNPHYAFATAQLLEGWVAKTRSTSQVLSA